MTLFLIPTFTAGIALAGTTDLLVAPAEMAVRMLSRHAPGELPVSEPVIGAIEVLGENGASDCAPLLKSLADHEQDAVAAAANQALRQVRVRTQMAQRKEFIDGLPRRDAISSWLKKHPDAAMDRSGAKLGPHDVAALAYATMVLGQPGEDGPTYLELVAPEDGNWLLAQAEDSARAGRLPEAVATWAQAAASGSLDATAALNELDIDVERLLLGMTAATGNAPAVVLPAGAVEALLPSHGKETVAVLIERARQPAPLTRVVALDALAELAEREVMTPRERAAAHRTMVEAASDPLPAVRALAATALSRSMHD